MSKKTFVSVPVNDRTGLCDVVRQLRTLSFLMIVVPSEMELESVEIQGISSLLDRLAGEIQSSIKLGCG